MLAKLTHVTRLHSICYLITLGLPCCLSSAADTSQSGLRKQPKQPIGHRDVQLTRGGCRPRGSSRKRTWPPLSQISHSRDRPNSSLVSATCIYCTTSS